MSGIIVVVSGGRDYADRDHVYRELLELHNRHPLGAIDRVVHGACGWDASDPDRGRKPLKGADRWAHEWAAEMRVPVVPCPADWTRLGNKAGPARNGQMLDQHKPDIVLAFPGGSGTKDLLLKCFARGVRFLYAGRP